MCYIADGQHIGHQLHKQNGGLNFTSLIQPRLRSLAMVPRKINHSHGTAFTRVSKCHWRLRIPGKSRFQRLATGFISVSTTEQKMGALRNRSVCNKTDCTTAKICELETRSSGGGSGCFHTGLEPIHSVCIPSICTNRVLSTADTATVSLKNNHSDTSLGNPTLVSTITRNDHRYSSAPPSIPRVTETRGQATTLDHLQLAAWHVSGQLSKVLQYHSQLKNVCWQHGDPGRKKLTLPPGESGLAGVVNNKSILFQPLSSQF